MLAPKVSYANFPTLTADAVGSVFTFGADANGYAITPIGKVGIYPSVSAFPDNPWVEGQDYVSEVTQIRLTNNRTWSQTLYWYGTANPADIAAAVQPALFPEASRRLIVVEAVRQFATEAARNPDLAGTMAAEWERIWPYWCLVWKTQFRSGGALAPLTSSTH